MIDQSQATKAKETLERIVNNVETVIVGKREQVELVTLALVARGHVLLEDYPGTGKTSLALALAKSIDSTFRRIQFNPDLMPTDITGTSIYNEETKRFEFHPGAIMGNIVLADEINRAPAKAQAALLEAMEERQVTVDGNTYKLEDPFIVLATQNPIEQMGTFDLPEAQMDRFMMKLSLGYASMAEEVSVVLGVDEAKAALAPVVSGQQVVECIDLARQVTVSQEAAQYAVMIATATRNSEETVLGASPRGSIALVRMAQANALLRGRTYVMPDDIKYLAPYVLAHRISLKSSTYSEGRTAEDVINSIVESVAVPNATAAQA